MPNRTALRDGVRWHANLNGGLMLRRILNKFITWKLEHRAMVVDFPTDDQIQTMVASRRAETHSIIAFYTKDRIYENEARRMVASAKRLQLDVKAVPVAGVGSWVRNASMKASFLAKQRPLHKGPLLYVDVDAVFHSNPWPYLNTIEADIAVYYEPNGRLLAGTILISDTPASQKILDEWARRCNANPDIWDQVVLEEIIAEDAMSNRPQYDVARLPVSFCWIFDKLDNDIVDEIYIEQLQASRETKKKVRLFGRVGRSLKRRRQRAADIERILFHNK